MMKVFVFTAVWLLALVSPAIADQTNVIADPFAPKVHIEVKKYPLAGSFYGKSLPPLAEPELDPLSEGCSRLSGSVVCGFARTSVGEVAPIVDADDLDRGDILEAIRTIGLPSRQASIQPAGTTLVGLDTIFFTDAAPFTATVTLLGYRVDIAATPASFTWHHGDGTSQTTESAGRPYPDKDITHTYDDTADHLAASVDVTYRVKFRIDGGNWQNLDQPLTAIGPTTDLQVKQGTALLTH